MRADLAVMDSDSFCEEYNISQDKYRSILKEGVEDLIEFLFSLCSGIISGDIKCKPDKLRERVIRIYQYRIIRLQLSKYEVNGCPISYRVGTC